MKIQKTNLLILYVLVLSTLMGCETSSEAFSEKSETELRGQVLYDAKCAMCHGEQGAGGYSHKNIQGLGLTNIRLGIETEPDMAFLKYLNSKDLHDIKNYMATLSGGNALTTNVDIVKGEAEFRGACAYCHSLDNSPIERVDGSGKKGKIKLPYDLLDVSTKYSKIWLAAWIDNPKKMADAGAYGGSEFILEEDFPYVMQDLLHSADKVQNIVAFLAAQEKAGAFVVSSSVSLSDAQFEASKQDYFNNCAGCHGLYRTGATGPNIGELRSKDIGTDGLRSMITYGTPAGMGNFGQAGELTDTQVTNLAAYLQLPPPDAPALPMVDIQASWELLVPVDERPISPQHGRNWENYTGVILRDAGQVAIFDGDENEEIASLSTGFAVHILRMSATGRYIYVIGRDGKVTLIDLWYETPTIVANVKGCHDARSVESSKFTGYENKYLIEGCYWPPQYVVYDGLTLEPIQRVDVPMTDIDDVTLIENRVASIIASPHAPIWVASLKEAGIVAVVDYSDPNELEFPIVKEIKTAKFLHDGGLDHTGLFYMVAANASNKMVVIDLFNQDLEAMIDTGLIPHPGRGANWQDPVYGWVNATSHIGEGKVSVYGADPIAHPEHAWKVVREITLPSSGSLFVKSHYASPWVFVDMTLSATGYEKDICVISKATGTLNKCFTVAKNGRAVHFDFNKGGSEVWVSDWAADGAVIVLDSTTLAELRRFVNLQTPTGKFNVYNTAHDVY